MEKHNSKVSVIVPNYNHANHLRQRIESILAQTYSNFEIILLDDCSTDGSREIIESYRNHPMVTHIEFNASNTGSPFKQWKKGLEIANGEWIWFAESDDYADPDFLIKLVEAIGDRKRVGLAYSDSFIVEGNTVLHESFASLKNKRFDTNRWSMHHVNMGRDEIENYLLLGGTINNSSAVVFNKKILMETNPFDINLKYIGDKYAFLKVLNGSEVVYVPERLNYYRDPFNTKHADKLIYYFYEQFLVFDWVYRHVDIDKKKFYRAFYANAQNSLFRNWNRSKLKMYKSLFRVNRRLWAKSLSSNLLRSFGAIFSDRNAHKKDSGSIG